MSQFEPKYTGNLCRECKHCDTSFVYTSYPPMYWCNKFKTYVHCDQSECEEERKGRIINSKPPTHVVVEPNPPTHMVTTESQSSPWQQRMLDKNKLFYRETDEGEMEALGKRFEEMLKKSQDNLSWGPPEDHTNGKERKIMERLEALEKKVDWLLKMRKEDGKARWDRWGEALTRERDLIDTDTKIINKMAELVKAANEKHSALECRIAELETLAQIKREGHNDTRPNPEA